MGYFTGDDGDNEVEGSDDHDVIYGFGGHDFLLGFGGQDYIDGWSGNDDIFGHSGDDTILGYLGNDLISGGEDNDVINGGVGEDLLYGGLGADTFDYNYTTDSNVAYGIDWIFDLTSSDTIDLWGVDANSTVNGDQAFDWNLTVGTAGAIDWDWDGSRGAFKLIMDINGGDADMVIYVSVESWGSFIL